MVFIKHAFKNTVLFFFVIVVSCGSTTKTSNIVNIEEQVVSISDKNSTPNHPKNKDSIHTPKPIITGANQTELYLPLLNGKKVAIVGNQTSVIFKSVLDSAYQKTTSKSNQYTHLVDSLLARNINIKKVFAPEHGFRGKADAAEMVANGNDIKTGLPIISLYGKSKKLTPAMLENVDILIFDIQDVGARFYTYISTLHYVMQACAENNVPLLILDRPNPNGHYVDGPTLESEHSSFVGMHPIPLVHGMTIGEYAKMVNGEGWLGTNLKCPIQVIPVKNYDHQKPYSLPIRPSPNLPNDKSINLYPSLGFFEGTTINAGRGTEMQFQIFGSPDLNKEIYTYTYTPNPNFGSKTPKHQEIVCNGQNLTETPHLSHINLQWIIDAYQNSNNKENFFITDSFTVHAGNTRLQQQIIDGYTHREIRKTWLKDLEKFKKTRAQYLIYN